MKPSGWLMKVPGEWQSHMLHQSRRRLAAMHNMSGKNSVRQKVLIQAYGEFRGHRGFAAVKATSSNRLTEHKRVTLGVDSTNAFSFHRVG